MAYVLAGLDKYDEIFEYRKYMLESQEEHVLSAKDENKLTVHPETSIFVRGKKR